MSNPPFNVATRQSAFSISLSWLLCTLLVITPLFTGMGRASAQPVNNSQIQVAANELVTLPSPEVDFLIGPQVRSGTSTLPGASWFDQNAIDRGLSLCSAFPDEARTPGNVLVTGTVSVTNGSRTVTGVGTRFLTEAKDYAIISNGTSGRLIKIVSSVQSDTSLTLTLPWQGTTLSGQTMSSPTAMEVDNYQGYLNYYDFALTQYTNYYRTGDARFLACARKVSDSWWSQPVIDYGRNLVSATGDGLAPRSVALTGLILRALDGRPEMWPWITDYVDYHYHNWVEVPLNWNGLYYGIRDGGFMLLYAADLGAVHPNPTVRQSFRTRALTGAVSYYARLQNTDGSYRWNVEDSSPGSLDGFTGMEQPFMVGILNEGMIATHRLTGDLTVKNAILKSVEHEYLRSFNPNGWRAMYYFVHGQFNNGHSCEAGCGNASNPFPPSDPGQVTDARQLNATAISQFGYAYQLTGDLRFKTWGDNLFDATYSGADGYRGLAAYRGKEYDESYRTGARYLAWSMGPIPTPSPTPTPSPIPTPSPSPTPTPSPSPTPTPLPSPTPTPSPSPTPAASPTPTPTPSPTPTPTPLPSAAATFVRLDTTTKGNWKGVYGSQGYNTINDALSYPSYAQINVTGYTSPTWDDSTTDVRALQKALGSDRVAARWSANSSFTIELNMTDGQAHRVALYNLDWDGNNRSQRIDVIDWATNTLLDSRSISSFNGGQYLVWDISGRVKISVVRTGAKTAVLSGLYFGAAGNPTPTPTPTPSPSPTPTPTPGGNIAPTVTIANPTGGTVFGSGSNVSISANAGDPDGRVTKVDFFKNGNLIGTSTSSPYTFVWNNIPNGNYSLTAKATDNLGATTMSSSVAISVKNSPASVERARDRGNNLLISLATSPGYGGSDALSAATLTTELLTLVDDIQVAYGDFQAEQSSFTQNATRINAQLQAALYITKADAGLASRLGASASVTNNLLRAVAHLAITKDLLMYGSVTPATQSQAAAATSRLDVVIGPAPASYTPNGSTQIAPLSLGSVFGNATLSPLSTQTLFAPIGPGGSVPYELGGVNVSIGGKAAPVVFVSPARVSFYVAPDIAPGVAEVIVTSQSGFVSRGITTIAPNASRLLTTNEGDNGPVTALNTSTQNSSNFALITSENFSSDKRTRVSLLATGISGSAINSNPLNDILVDGLQRQNFAETVVVEARLTNGTVINLPVEFAGKQGILPGLDQVTVLLTSQLAGAGTTQLTVIVGGQRSNPATMVVQ